MAYRLEQCTEVGARLLKQGMPAGEARREARILMRHVLKLGEYEYLNEPDRRLSRSDFGRFASLIRRRAKGEPFAYLTGTREFFSIEFQVDPSVLIPRPETEELIEHILKDFPEPPQRVVDIGTGSGCIAAILAMQWKDSDVIAADISADALETARRNFLDLALEERITIILSDLLEDVPGTFDLIVSNPPYVLKEEFASLDRDVRDFEPAIALIVDDPGGFYRRLFRQSFRQLNAGGRLYLESSPALLPLLTELAQECGFNHLRVEKDLSGKDRFLVAWTDSVQA